MLRSAVPDDVPLVLDLIVAAELFSAKDAPFVGEMLGVYFGPARGEGHACLVEAADDGTLRGVVYWEPWRGSDGGWNLLMLAVDLGSRRRGIAGALVGAVEQQLASAGERLLLVETSGTPAFAAARAFYEASGYDEDARVGELWAAGDDMVLFRKDLQQT